MVYGPGSECLSDGVSNCMSLCNHGQADRVRMALLLVHCTCKVGGTIGCVGPLDTWNVLADASRVGRSGGGRQGRWRHDASQKGGSAATITLRITFRFAFELDPCRRAAPAKSLSETPVSGFLPNGDILYQTIFMFRGVETSASSKSRATVSLLPLPVKSSTDVFHPGVVLRGLRELIVALVVSSNDNW
jgi:hypothetical protein